MMECLVFIVLLGSFHEVQVKQALPQAKLTADSSIITETDSVTLSCEAPAHLSVNECYFYVNRETIGSSSCMKTFTGTELLLMAKQSLPSVVEVRCFYSVKNGIVNSPSPDSDVALITIGLKPQLRVHYVKGVYAIFICHLPKSVKSDTRCNLYFGESSHPTETTTRWKTKSSETSQWFCRTVIQENELLGHLRLVQQKQASCDYSLKDDRKGLSPRSDPYSFNGEGKVTEIRTTSTRSTRTTGSVDSEFPTKVSSSVTSIYKVAAITEKAGNHEPTGKNTNLKTFIITAAVGGVIVTFILMLAACFRRKRRTEKRSQKRKQTNIEDQSVQMIDNTEVLYRDPIYGFVISLPAAAWSTDSGKSAAEDSPAEDSDADSLYCTIPDLPPPSSTGDGV